MKMLASRLVCGASLLALLISAPVWAQETQPTDAQRDTVVVYGRSIEQIGVAKSASEGVVGYTDLSARPVSRAAELVEVIPGMIATEHSSGGKANQYFLRGFNLDHGTDFAGFVDGVPLNRRSHPHMSGYLDLNFLVADLVQRVEFKKGVQYAENGDFSSAGSAAFVLYDSLPETFAEVRIEPDEYGLVAAGSWDIADGTFLAAVSHQGGDGPFDLPADLSKTSLYLKYTQPMGDALLRLGFIGYGAEWTPTDQIPLRAVQSGAIGRFGTIDPTSTSDTSRYIGYAALEWDDASVLGYVEKSTLDLYHNFTYYLDQALGDQFLQVEDRLAAGARARISRDFEIGGMKATGRIGADAHMDWIDQTGLYHTSARVIDSAIRDDEVNALAADVWGDLTLHVTDRLRAVFGLRVDYMDLDVTAISPANSGSDSGAQWSPKLNIAYRVTDDLEVYAGAGFGFHTNDPSGVVLTQDPVSGDPVESATMFAESRGGEIGLRWEPDSAFNLSAAIFALDFDSELIYAGDSGVSEPSDPTRRYGVEFAGFWNPVDWLAFDASYAYSHTRFKDAPSSFNRVPNSIEGVAAAGMTYLPGDGWEAALRVRYLGPGPLIEDNSVRAPSTTLVNAGVSKDFGSFEIGLDVLNLFDAEDYDMVYFYESQLAGEAAPVEDIHFHPVHPQTFVLSLKAKY